MRGKAGQHIDEGVCPSPSTFGRAAFLHVVSRWQRGAPGLDRDPLSPCYGEASAYEVVAPGRGALLLHPSRVVRFLGNPWPDPSVAPTPLSDSILPALYDAIHAVAQTMAGATSLMHETKVDIVTVPNLSEHLSSVETTDRLSARFGYAAAMTSINNLLLLGDGETWNRQRLRRPARDGADLRAGRGGGGRHQWRPFR